jgi:hypothetical protein
MIRIADKDKINELELIIVMDYIKSKGIERGTIYQGNGCLWLAAGSANRPLNYYFLFRGGQLVGVDID